MDKYYSLEFYFDERGFGDLNFLCGPDTRLTYLACSGSINANGSLVNCITPGVYTMRELPVVTVEDGMSIPGHECRKWRLHDENGPTHLLIHLDAGLPGTKGCIGIKSHDPRGLDALWDLAAVAIESQGVVQLTAGLLVTPAAEAA
jgi:hypothetical protein